MHAIVNTGPADRSGSAGPMPPFPPALDDRDDDILPALSEVPPAEAERPRSLLDRLLDAICTPTEGNYNDP
jgi:hypothetical protein